MISWNKIKAKIADLSADAWDAEESELRRIMEKLPAEERQLNVTFQHAIDCSGDLAAIKTTISFSERFKFSVSGSIDDPAQLQLGEKEEKEKS